MPGRDGTGPQGRGPLTGGGRGNCVIPREQLDALEKERPAGVRFRDFLGFGRGGGRGPRRGRGWRFWKRND